MIGIGDRVRPVQECGAWALDTADNGMAWQTRKQTFKFVDTAKVIDINESMNVNDVYESSSREFLIEGPYGLYGWIDEKDVELAI